MGPSYQLEAIHVVELRGNLVPKQPTRPSRTHCPCPYILRITPYQIAKRPLMRNLLRPCNDTDLIQRADFRAQAAVHAEDFSVDNGAEYEEVKHLTAGFPHGGVTVLGLAFFVEAVDLGYLAGLVVTSDEGYAVGISGVGLVSQAADPGLVVLTWLLGRGVVSRSLG